MLIDKALAEALADLSLDPLSSQGEALDDSLIAGYSLTETGASNTTMACWQCCCCCSCQS
jgi:hypothetical protein